LASAFSSSSKFEVSPEEIKLNFSDVRGVIKNSLFLFLEIHLSIFF
jgi:SpoVK/Ycf46/Vps4 family AAA+-type ATPase